MANRPGHWNAVDRLLDYLAGKYGEGVRRGSYTLYSNRDLGAKIAERAPTAIRFSVSVRNGALVTRSHSAAASAAWMIGTCSGHWLPIKGCSRSAWSASNSCAPAHAR